ncbi:MAG: putative acyltransferase [Verrucomicrobiales bacterium]|nr:putative acyltransferase [Verrucomicrobiales bacterium]
MASCGTASPSLNPSSPDSVNRPFYFALCLFGRGPLWFCSRKEVRGGHFLDTAGGCLLAANHRSPYDCMMMMGSTWRVIRWVSAVEVSLGPWRRFFRWIGVIPLDRSKRDPKAVRRMISLMQSGEVVGLFPEGTLRTGSDAVTSGGSLNENLCRLAQLAQVPVVPCAVAGGEQFSRWTAWLPLRRTRWAVHFGEPLPPGPDLSQRLREALIRLYAIAANPQSRCARPDSRQKS